MAKERDAAKILSEYDMPKRKYTSDRESERRKLYNERRAVGREEGKRRHSEYADDSKNIFQAAFGRGKDKVKDLIRKGDMKISELTGMQRRALKQAGLLEGLKDEGFKRGGRVKSKMSKAGGVKKKTTKVTKSRGDGIAMKGKTRGRIV